MDTWTADEKSALFELSPCLHLSTNSTNSICLGLAVQQAVQQVDSKSKQCTDFTH